MNHGLDLRQVNKFRKTSKLPGNKVETPIHYLPGKRQGAYKTAPDDHPQNPTRERKSSIGSLQLFTPENFSNIHQTT